MTISFAWLPDAVQFVKEIMHTATGKINKLAARHFPGLPPAGEVEGGQGGIGVVINKNCMTATGGATAISAASRDRLPHTETTD